VVQWTIPPPQFPFERWVDGAQAGPVFQAIKAWLEEERAKVKEEQPPVRIKALQGKRRVGWGYEVDAQKWLEFQVVQADAGVHVRVVAFPPKGAQFGVREQMDLARENYAKALEPLWARFGTASPEGLPAVPPGKHWETQIVEGRRMVRQGVWALLGLTAAVAALIGYNVATGAAPVPRALGSLFGVLLSTVAMGAVFSLVRGRTRVREARSHLEGHGMVRKP